MNYVWEFGDTGSMSDGYKGLNMEYIHAFLQTFPYETMHSSRKEVFALCNCNIVISSSIQNC